MKSNQAKKGCWRDVKRWPFKRNWPVVPGTALSEKLKGGGCGGMVEGLVKFIAMNF
jgi:hypothetical protein